MRSTFHGLETAKRGLFAQQTAIQTTGHNIANANTKGYTRQMVDFVASKPIEAPGLSHSTAPGQLGTGVDFSNIRRIRESFLDEQFRNQNKDYGDWTIRQDTLEKLEAIVNEPSDYGIRSVVDDFWNAWQDLAGQPDNLTARSVVMERAGAMADAFNDVASKLQDLKNDLTESINIKVTEVNTLTKQIANLNKEIFRVEGLGDQANDLRDQRDLLTDQLSKLVNIDVINAPNGYTIKMGNTELVNGINVPTVLDANALPADLTSGEIHGYLLSRDQYVQDFQAQMDAMVKGLVEGEFELTIPTGTILPDGTTLTKTDGTTVTYTGDANQRTVTSDITVIIKGINGLHQLGYTLQDPLQAGGLFFTTKDGSGSFTANNIQVNPDITADVRNIAASTRTYTYNDGTNPPVEKVVKGNNQLALWIGQMRNVSITFDNTNNAVSGEGTFDEYFRSMVGQLGVKAQEATRQAENQKVLVEQVDSRRESVSGVSLDEEMANLIKFQHAYNASARMITTIDEMLDKVINGMGIVGR
ncbi:flagellar hook-associated protein FlgK [Tepidibacillus sp. HK-1]|uniref:flagellar hook-associated protein FlgK n=1 Tax=Tepidibacillus sp. HK-1 TaxID=1883407 RepID=UPI00085362AE|nr:flagellar hook-associated protein FlgK [Tepidibacillus sp. HK-1]GBF10536.1 flagellar hook-associated protein 1 [Tepidibacillus sp. HK-1]